MEEPKPIAWVRKTWDQLKAIRPGPVGRVKLPVGHPGAVHGNKILKLHQLKYSVKMGRIPTNHQRVMMLRAIRMRISLAEYKRRFCMDKLA
jgi:hypothetical protein